MNVYCPVQHDLMRFENQMAAQDYLDACRERAIADEVDRLKDLTVGALIADTDLIWLAPGFGRQAERGLCLELEEIIEAIAAANVMATREANSEF